MIYQAKARYYKEKLSTKDASSAFKIINSLLKPDTGKQLPVAASDQQLADNFATYFAEKVEKIRESLSGVEANIASFPPEVNTERHLNSFVAVSEDHVKKIIDKCPAKSCALDPVPTWFLKDSAVIQAVMPQVTAYINASLASACVPDCHKSALVTPLLKKDGLDTNEYKNYRPVSNITFVSKILEKVVVKQLVTHMTDNDMYDHLQSAYRAGHSTESALVKVKSDIDTALAEGDGVLLLLLDLSSAFDTVDHSVLLQRLESLIGVTGAAKQWIQSYLSSRTQVIAVGEARSKPVALTTGVPQGSVLGPLMFLAYVLPLGTVIDRHQVSRQGYADDSQLYRQFSLKHVSAMYEAIDTLQICAEDARQWMTQNMLKVNDSKTEFLIIAPKNFHALIEDLNVTIKIGQATTSPCS
jgi:hypothetical protein